mmetsp:Transcript_16906/g.30265  ORF Transcript_16906/g.30265 Transcript_16906/m.30265 type:complete len:1879 (+) Transcript_16906:8599-14235(+)
MVALHDSVRVYRHRLNNAIVRLTPQTDPAVIKRLRETLISKLPDENETLLLTQSSSDSILSLGLLCAVVFDAESFQHFFKYFDLIEHAAFPGLPDYLAGSEISNFIDHYFRVLEQIVTSCPEGVRVDVHEKFSQLINLRHRDFLKKLVEHARNSGRKMVSAYAMHVLKACSGQLVHADLAEDLWESIQLNYLQERKRSCKYQALHITILNLASSLLQMHPSFLESQHLTLSELFQVAQGLTKKFIMRKTTSEPLLLASCRYILVVLSTPGINEAGVIDIQKGSRQHLKLRTADVSSGLEFYLKYFTSDLLVSRPEINREVVMMTKQLIPRYLSAYPEYKKDFLVFYHRLLIGVAPKFEPSFRDFIIDQMVSLTESFDSASRDLALSYLQQIALEDLEQSISSLLLLVSRILKTGNSSEGARIISQIMAWLRTSASLNQYAESLSHLAAAAQSEEQFSELIQIMMESLESDTNIESTIKRGLLSLTTCKYATLFADLVLKQLNRRLLFQEKSAYLLRNVNAVRYAETQLPNYELLLEVVVICGEAKAQCKDQAHVRLFWSLVCHFNFLEMKGKLTQNWLDLLRRFSLQTGSLERVNMRAFAGVNLSELYSCRDYAENFTSRAREFLSKLVPDERKAAKVIEYEPAIYCISVATVEELKLNSKLSILQSCLNYFADEQIWQEDEALKLVMKSIIFRRIREYLVSLQSSEPNQSREDLVAADFVYLLQASCSRTIMTQALAQEILDLHLTRRVPRRRNLIKGLNLSTCYMYQFPYIYEQFNVMSTALSAYGCLATANNFQSAPRTMTLPLCKTTLELPLEKAGQSDVLWFLTKTVEEGFGKAITLSSKNVMCTFSHFSYVCSQIIKVNTDSNCTSVLETACSLFNSLLYKYMLFGSCPLDPEVPYCQPISFHDWFLRLETVDFRIGEANASEAQQLQSYSNLLMAANSLLKVKTHKEVAAELCESLLTDPGNLVDTLGKLVAVLTIGMRKEQSKQWVYELLHCIVWAPALALQLSSSVVNIWEWLASTSPKLKSKLYREITSLWNFLLYRGGIVVPGSLHMATIVSQHDSPLFHSPQTIRLASLRSTGEQLSSVKFDNIVTDTFFNSVRLEDLLSMQLCVIQFYSREFHPCLVRNDKAAQEIIEVVKMTVSCPADASTSNSPAAHELLMSLMKLGFAITKSRKVDLEAHVFRFALEFFSDSPKWVTIERRDYLEQMLVQLEGMQMSISMLQPRDLEVITPKLRLNFSKLYLASRELYRIKAFSQLGQSTEEVTRRIFLTKNFNELLKLILLDEVERLKSWNDPVSSFLRGMPKKTLSVLSHPKWLETCWSVHPMTCISFFQRFQHYYIRNKNQAYDTIQRLANSQPECWLHVPFLVRFCSIEMEPWLHCYDAPRLSICLPLLKSNSKSSYVTLQNFALRAISRVSSITQIYYLTQVLQSSEPLKAYAKYSRPRNQSDIFTFLLKAAKNSDYIRNHLDWICRVVLYHKNEDKKKSKKAHDTSGSVCAALHAQLMEETRANPSAQQNYEEENEFFSRINLLSASLTPHDPANIDLMQKGLRDLAGDGYQVPSHIYLPTNPERKVEGVRVDNPVPLQSAKRVPMLINFITSDGEGGRMETPCIFKINDDVRNDQLCLQIIELMRDIFLNQGMPLYLRPYKVISTMTQIKGEHVLGGILECIPKTKSRDEIGKEGSESLFAYYREKYGAVESQRFQTAKLDFIQSSAAYAVASYILQIKDRHNGNILYDDAGHLLHIDFGFILSISPGGNMRFEKSDFKLTSEMIELMGGEESESFQYFRELVVKGFLIVRDYAEDIFSLVESLENSGLTCFRKDSMTELRARFLEKKSPAVACKEMQEKINKANNSFFTNWYDRIQLMQQRIEY